MILRLFKKSISLFLIMAILSIGNTISAQSIITPEARTYTNAKYSHSLPYRLYKPLNYNSQQSYPLVLFLHGSGERGNDNYLQISKHCVADYLADSNNSAKYPCFILAPQCPAKENWIENWGNGPGAETNPSLSDELDMVMDNIAQLKREFSIDAKRVYVIGLSMGGYGAWGLIGRYPDTFAAAVPMSSGGDSRTTLVLKDKPIWAFHSEDDSTVYVENSREMIKNIKFVGGNPKYTEYPASLHLGHGCWETTYARDDLFPWLFSQSLPSSPSINTITTPLLNYAIPKIDLPVCFVRNNSSVDSGKVIAAIYDNKNTLKNILVYNETNLLNAKSPFFTNIPLDLSMFKVGDQYKAKLFFWDATGMNQITPVTEIPLETLKAPGDGLKAEYFNGINFNTPILTRTDSTVGFAWQGTSPGTSVNANSFSVRWSGQIEPRFSETYTFSAFVDDGIRLWVNDQLIIDDWNEKNNSLSAFSQSKSNPYRPPYSGSIQLEADKKYNVRMEYYSNNGGANTAAMLFWCSHTEPFGVIPQMQLFSSK